MGEMVGHGRPDSWAQRWHHGRVGGRARSRRARRGDREVGLNVKCQHTGQGGHDDAGWWHVMGMARCALVGHRLGDDCASAFVQALRDCVLIRCVCALASHLARPAVPSPAQTCPKPGNGDVRSRHWTPSGSRLVRNCLVTLGGKQSTCT